MKPQDIIFIITLLLLLWPGTGRYPVFMRNRAKNLVVAGLMCLILSIPLFAFWVFFTAERLVWYAAAFFLIAICLLLFKSSGDDVY